MTTYAACIRSCTARLSFRTEVAVGLVCENDRGLRLQFVCIREAAPIAMMLTDTQGVVANGSLAS